MTTDPKLRSEIAFAIAEALGSGVYDCTRVWAAWHYNTMTENDFVPISYERIDEIADAVLAVIAERGKHQARETGRPDKNGRMIMLGDHIRILNKSTFTREEYWFPEYEVCWAAPTFHLKHIGGGEDGGDSSFFTFRTCAREVETIKVAGE